MMHIPRGKFSHFHACAILYREQQPNCKPGLNHWADVTGIWENQFRRTTDNMCQFTIYRENQTQLLAKQIKARITSSMLRGGLWKVEVFLDAKEDRGASCSVWTLGLTSFWQPTAHPTCNIQQAKTGAKTQSICRNCNAWNSSSSSPMRFVAQNSPTFSEWTF